ncbi:MAG: hypothetical protein AVDCRST_MAG45-234, partial [uncultured Solirubrobacterales bacterium]
ERSRAASRARRRRLGGASRARRGGRAASPGVSSADSPLRARGGQVPSRRRAGALRRGRRPRRRRRRPSRPRQPSEHHGPRSVHSRSQGEPAAGPASAAGRLGGRLRPCISRLARSEPDRGHALSGAAAV